MDISYTTDINSPAYESPGYRAQLGELQVVQDCFDGINSVPGSYLSLWQGARIYLPKEERESDLAYSIRLRRSTFWNAYRRTITGLVGMAFRKSPVLQSDVPPLIKSQMENVDLMGSHLDVFAKEIFQWSFEGHAAILVDMPKSITASNPKATLADERAAGIRPYWSLVRKGQIVNAIAEQVGGSVRLAQVTIKEQIGARDGKYGSECITQYRVLYRGGWELWRSVEGKPPILVDEGKSTGVTEIPLVLLPMRSTGFCLSRPVLLDLAFENLRHFRLQSDLDHILHVINVPILCEILGDNSNDLEQLTAGGKLTDLPGMKPERVISPNSVYLISHGGDLKFVEHQGNAIDKAQAEIKTARGNAATLGLSMLLEQAPTVASTATQNVLGWESETSELAGMIRTEEDAVEKALEFQAEYLQLDTGGKVKFSRELTRMRLDGQFVGGLSMMVKDGGLSLETMWSVLELGSLLPADFDSEKEKQRLLKEFEEGLHPAQIRETITKPAPGGPPPANPGVIA